VVDLEETFREQQKAMTSVKPISIEIPMGKIIIRKGEIVTPKHIEILEDLGIYRPNIDIKGLTGALFLSIIFILIIIEYLKQYQPEILKDAKKLWLIILIVISIAVISRWSTKISGFIAPVATASILLTIIVDSRLAILVTVIFSMLISIFTNSIPAGAVALLTGITAVTVFVNVKGKKDFFYAAIIITSINMLATAVFSLIQDETIVNISINSLIWGLANGLFSCLIALGVLPFVLGKSTNAKKAIV